MPFIELVQSNGTCYPTNGKLGSIDENNYFRVVTERWGKLFFASEEDYSKWCTKGRRRNEASGCIASAKSYFKNTFEGNDELMIVEAYQVEDTVAPAANTAAGAAPGDGSEV